MGNGQEKVNQMVNQTAEISSRTIASENLIKK
jgi:hypothetical protein